MFGSDQPLPTTLPGNPLYVCPASPRFTTPPSLHAGFNALQCCRCLRNSNNDARICTDFGANTQLPYFPSTPHTGESPSGAQDSVPAVANFAGWDLHPLGCYKRFLSYMTSPSSGLLAPAWSRASEEASWRTPHPVRLPASGHPPSNGQRHELLSGRGSTGPALAQRLLSIGGTDLRERTRWRKRKLPPRRSPSRRRS